MASTTGTRKDPFLAFRFEVSFGSRQGGFSECTGLGLEIEVQEYVEGGVNDFVHKFPTRVKLGNLTLKRGVLDASLWEWCTEVVPGKLSLVNGTIQVLGADAAVVMKWEVQNAFPVKIQGPDLNAGQSSVAVETLEICHQGLVRIQ